MDKKEKFQLAGFFVLCLGMIFGNTENLLIPVIIAAIGGALVLAGKRAGDAEREEENNGERGQN